MTDRVLDISEKGAQLRVTNSLLAVHLDGEAEVTIPLGDLAVVVAAHPQITFTHAVLSGLAEAGAVLVTCDTRRRPVSMMLPLISHSIQTERFSAQARLGLPTKKRLWQQIVKAKLFAQARVLEENTGSDKGVRLLARGVGSGDPANREAQAARIYWNALFGDLDFRRHEEGDGLNACLDYGYAILRATTARALCAAGLNPTLGIHHRNRYNPFCLADDLMEPFRAIVDRTAIQLLKERSCDIQLDRKAKLLILECLLGRFSANGESRTLFDWIAKAAFSLAAVVAGEGRHIEIVEIARAET